MLIAFGTQIRHLKQKTNLLLEDTYSCSQLLKSVSWRGSFQQYGLAAGQDALDRVGRPTEHLADRVGEPLLVGAALALAEREEALDGEPGCLGEVGG